MTRPSPPATIAYMPKVVALSASPGVAPTPEAAARRWAEGFPFTSATAQKMAIARTKAPQTGPEPVRRAFALHQTWENNDLGVARLFELSWGKEQLWAIHTSTDGDDGFLELFDRRGTLLASGVSGYLPDGRHTVRWDAQPGAVRERLAPPDISPPIADYYDAVAEAQSPQSPGGAQINVAEARAATQILVNDALTHRSVDGFEAAALRKTLADPSPKLTFGARQFVTQLGDLYQEAAPKTLRNRQDQPILGDSAFAQAARGARAEVAGKKQGPQMAAFLALSRESWDLLPTQVVPATRTQALQTLGQMGATEAEAKTYLDNLGDNRLFVGRLYRQGDDWQPQTVGSALFSASADGKKISGVYVPAAPPAPAIDVFSVIAEQTGVRRPGEVISEESTPAGTQFRLRWRPPQGGELLATVTLPNDGEPEISQVQVPPAQEARLAQSLQERLQNALGPTQLMGWAGQDNARGPAFVVAHRPENGPPRLAHIQILMGGAAEVTPHVFRANHADTARFLALNLAKSHAQTLVADPQISDAARLEVALRTAWATPDVMEAVPAEDSAVGFDPARERFQWMLSGVWGDNAIFVTFAQDGTLRVEDFN